MPKIASEIDCNSHGTDNYYSDSYFMAIIIGFWGNFVIFISICCLKKHEKFILFIDLDAEFHVLKLLVEDFLAKIIRGTGNCESLSLRVKFLYLKFGGTHRILHGIFFHDKMNLEFSTGEFDNIILRFVCFCRKAVCPNSHKASLDWNINRTVPAC